MKKYIIAATGFALTLTLVFVACTKKKDSNAIAPTYKEEGGTGGNPTKNEVTVTGSGPNTTNPATGNSGINTSTGFLYPSCSSTSSLSIKAVNGGVDVTVNFSQPPSVGTYQVTKNGVSPGYCTVVVNNAPSQPAGVVWYGKTGSVSVTTSTNGINAVLNSVACVQQSFEFPTVTVTGNMSCN